jgi:hypothetical protein
MLLPDPEETQLNAELLRAALIALKFSEEQVHQAQIIRALRNVSVPS